MNVVSIMTVRLSIMTMSNVVCSFSSLVRLLTSGGLSRKVGYLFRPTRVIVSVAVRLGRPLVRATMAGMT